MGVQRYIPIYCLQIKNEFIPFWKLTFHKDEDDFYGDYYTFENERTHYTNSLQECIWDTEKKVILTGIVKYITPESEYKIGENVYQEMKGGTLRETIIKNIINEEYESSIHKIKDMDKYLLKLYFTDEEQAELKVNDIYEIRTYKTFYELENGDIIKWSHELKGQYKATN